MYLLQISSLAEAVAAQLISICMDPVKCGMPTIELALKIISTVLSVKQADSASAQAIVASNPSITRL